ncbi:MAG: hypothetical protein AAF915_05485 [Cyanobacteria bacterium P01_D01_bin.50]
MNLWYIRPEVVVHYLSDTSSQKNSNLPTPDIICSINEKAVTAIKNENGHNRLLQLSKSKHI